MVSIGQQLQGTTLSVDTIKLEIKSDNTRSMTACLGSTATTRTGTRTEADGKYTMSTTTTGSSTQTLTATSDGDTLTLEICENMFYKVKK